MSTPPLLNMSVLELTIIITAAFLFSNVSLMLLLGQNDRLSAGVRNLKESFTNALSGFSLAPTPPRGCGLGRPAFGDAQQSAWGANADVDSPYFTADGAPAYNTGAYPYRVCGTDTSPYSRSHEGRRRLLRSPQPLSVKPCRPVQGNPPSARDSYQPPSRPGSMPRQCRSLPYALTSDLPTENELWPAAVDSGDGLGLPLKYTNEGFSNNVQAPTTPAPMSTMSSSAGGGASKYAFNFNMT